MLSFKPPQPLPLLFPLLTLLFSLFIPTISAVSDLLPPSPPLIAPPTDFLLPSDAVSLLSFKSKADLGNKLLFTLNERFDYCQWQGVKCVQGRVVRFVLQGFGLRGVFGPNTLTRLDQLRVLSLHNNSLAGPIPDLSGLVNLRSLFLDRNSFSGTFPPSILTLHRLQILDISNNNFTGPLPVGLSGLDRLITLRLEWNRFNGSVPPLNQSFLQNFSVTGNNLTGRIPATSTLSRFSPSSFSWNPDLCGEIINKACYSHSPFFEASNATSPSQPPIQTAQSQGVLQSPPSAKNHKITGFVLGISIGVIVLIGALFCLFTAFRSQRRQTDSKPSTASMENSNPNLTTLAIETQIVENSDFQTKAKKAVEESRVRKSGNLIFSVGEAPLYSLEQLMRASAELLGRGTIGTTYKAVLCNQLIVTVKRLDANKTAITSGEAFEQHMEAVGGLRHPNLVPVRAYFQAKAERLVIYDYQPNGSLFNLIHGSRSTRAKPLHWTSCLKIAEDVAQGLAYIHQASTLIHGNLKSSNVLLGADFEACLTDYGLSVLSQSSSHEDPDSAGYKAPETLKSTRRATPKCDIYAFGILLLELLTGKHPSQHPFLEPRDVVDWVRAMREDDCGESDRLVMLTEVASVCSLTSPEQRPTMWQVLKMIQEVKETVLVEDNSSVGF